LLPTFIQGNNFSVSVTAESKEEADQIFPSLSKDGKITISLELVFGTIISEC
jgi:PhnB protein